MRKICLVLSLCLLMTNVSLPAQSTKLNQPSMNFTSVAKKGIPAVVSIRVKTRRPETNSFFQQWPEEDDDTPEFFRQFFGIPKSRERMPKQQQPQMGQASGFIISSDGLVVTNAHVVREAQEITIVLQDGRELTGTVVGEDPNTDVAVVKVEGKDLPFLEFGNSDQLEVGQWVVAIGNPLGLQASLSVGVVSATGRNNLDIARIEDFIQTDAAINRGNSGGPLMNLEDEVVGMNTAIVTSMSGGGYMGIGFAIPSNIIQHVVQELVENGSVARGFMGVILQQVDHDLAEALGLQMAEGALIAEVSKDSPAEKAGLLQGDLILQYNQNKIQNISQLRNAISLMKPGTRVQLIVLRDGKRKILPLEVGEFPDESIAANNAKISLGLEVENITPSIAKNLEMHDAKGVVVSKVKQGSPAEWAGFRKGTVILEVNKQSVSSVEDFHRMIKETPENKPVLFLVRAGDSMRYVSLKVN